VGDGLHPAGEVAAFPDDGVGVAAGLDLGALVNAVQKLEEVSVLFFLGDLQQVEGHGQLLEFLSIEAGEKGSSEKGGDYTPFGQPSRLICNRFSQACQPRARRSVSQSGPCPVPGL
jgi:hypothetical protein